MKIKFSLITMQQHPNIKFLNWKENLDWVQYPPVWFRENQWQTTYQNLTRFHQSINDTVTCLLVIRNNLHSGNCSLRFTTTGVKGDRYPIIRHRRGTTLNVILQLTYLVQSSVCSQHQQVPKLSLQNSPCLLQFKFYLLITWIT